KVAAAAAAVVAGEQMIDGAALVYPIRADAAAFGEIADAGVAELAAVLEIIAAGDDPHQVIHLQRDDGVKIAFASGGAADLRVAGEGVDDVAFKLGGFVRRGIEEPPPAVTQSVGVQIVAARNGDRAGIRLAEPDVAA